MTKLIPYARQSRTGERSMSLDDQIEDMQKWAERAGVELLEPIVEGSTSGDKHWRERELGTVLARLEAGEGDGIVVSYFSRLTREKHSATFELLEALQPYRRVEAMSGRDVARGTEIDWQDVIQAHQARTERETLKRHLNRGKHRTWEKGAYVIPNIPAGYDQTYVEEERNGRTVRWLGPLRKNDHAEVVARAFQTRAAGGSWSEVARVMRGVPTSKGETIWSTQGVRGMARNLVYRGVLRCTCGCGEEKFVKELAVVSPSLWSAAQPKSEPTGRGRKDRGAALLAGMLVCRSCGKVMSHHAVRRGAYRYYLCREEDRCPDGAKVPAPAAEEYIKQEALSAFAAGGLNAGREPNVETLATLEHERDSARDRLAALVRLIDPLDPGAEERLHTARAEVEAAEVALLAEQESRREFVTEEEVRELFESASVEEQRRLIRLALLPMAVTPGRGDVAGRIEVAYRRVPRAAMEQPKAPRKRRAEPEAVQRHRAKLAQ
jgi:DNA invertase Pin-like site-specific DNA recombinase